MSSVRRLGSLLMLAAGVVALYVIAAAMLVLLGRLPLGDALLVLAALATATATIFYVWLTSRLVEATTTSARQSALTRQLEALSVLHVEPATIQSKPDGTFYGHFTIRNTGHRDALWVAIAVGLGTWDGSVEQLDREPHPGTGIDQSGPWPVLPPGGEWGPTMQFGAVKPESLLVRVQHVGMLQGSLRQTYEQSAAPWPGWRLIDLLIIPEGELPIRITRGGM